MRISTAILLAALALTQAARFKANEYNNDQCSGDSSYPHSDPTEVTMDDSTKAVYLAVSEDDQYIWQGFSDKSMNGGECRGDLLGNMTTGTHSSDDCNKLDGKFSRRVKCVKYCSIVSGGYPNCKH